ncbi:MlaC/ttg2D family ABC transporter substrate-binding protein [Thermomonas aquatica]|uniref:ABC transporter substrate-binding protein n=1 Tax=Thermomonas aquatica TaxID=2202149 RepID=A0A5B7ZU57_9GAMM|nr:ABC transporter substrate-binding protein [Thermomonas aquatica]QDA57332.1 ABC transporter substrate-binding protein [Thermomonas aquatica]
MKTTLSVAVLAALLAVASPAFALPAAPAPAVAQGQASGVVLDSANRILSTLDSRRAEFKSSPAALNQFIKSEFNRSFDADYAARLVLGVHGRGAPAGDVADFAAAMADSLTARYGTSLLDFNTKLSVKVKSETPLPGGRGVRVTTQMLRAGKDPIPVDYLLRNVGGKWKVFDVMIEGISYVQAFKNQFDAPLNQKSIKQVAADLRAGKLQASATK